jgi:cytochrome P450
LTDPPLRAPLRQEPEMVPQFVEESLRFWSVSHDNILCTVAEDMEFAGVRVSAGDAVVVSLPSANHDPTVFDRPDRFGLDRDARAHLAFGHGSHLCPGAPLARREIEMAVTSVFERFPGLRPAVEPDELSWRQASLVYGLDRLPVTW